jgi:hypothetical protein
LKAIPEENRGGELIFVSALQKESWNSYNLFQIWSESCGWWRKKMDR